MLTLWCFTRYYICQMKQIIQVHQVSKQNLFFNYVLENNLFQRDGVKWPSEGCGWCGLQVAGTQAALRRAVVLLVPHT